jgi:hypothetical protein
MVEGCHWWEPFKSEYFVIIDDFFGIMVVTVDGSELTTWQAAVRPSGPSCLSLLTKIT